MNKQHIAILVSFSGQGGVELVINNLCREFIAQGHHVDLLLVKATGEHLANVPKGVNTVKFTMSSTALCVPELALYLRRVKPGVLMAAKHRGIKAALAAKRWSGVKVPVVGQLHTSLSASLEHQKPIKRKTMMAEVRKHYGRLDHLVGVSQGVADDAAEIAALAKGQSSAIYNPIIDDDIYDKAREQPEHVFYASRSEPVFISAGRLTKQKDFKTLVRAFAEVRKSIDARLVILGEGKQRDDLLALAEELGVGSDMALPGFQANPYAWIKHSNTFVLSSAWEGFGNVLAEALALETACVSTDCKSGPSEILAGGQLGALVPVADEAALAQAMIESLSSPALDTLQVEEHIQQFTVEYCATRYLWLFDRLSNEKKH